MSFLDDDLDEIITRFEELESFLSDAARTADPRYPAWVRCST